MDVCAHAAIEMICYGITGVIFVKHNYNLNIPAVANGLSKQYWELDRRNSYVTMS